MIFHQPSNSLSNYHYNTYFYSNNFFDFHFHKNLELIYVIKGSVTCTVNQRTYILEANDFGLCLPCDIHRYEPEKNTLYWVLVFSEDFVRSFSKLIADKTGNGFSFRCDETLNAYIKEHLIYNSSPSILTLKSCLYAICEKYINSVELIERDCKKAEMITVISDYIQNNYAKPLLLREISAKLGYDYNYMSRYFRKVFQMTFTEFVNTYRLERAIELLENTDKDIITISYESGFQSVRNFNAFFKKNLKTTPTQYRKTSRK